jgi:ABC-type transporter Mla subunit MlaD
MKAILVELGMALDNRGVDVNQAALDLRPTLAAAGGVMRELGSQNADLRQFVADADQVVAQGAARSTQLGTTVNSLAAVLRTTAAHAAGLDAGLQTLPATLVQARRTSTELASTARAAKPLARQLAGSAGDLSTAATQLGPFLNRLARATRQLHPTLRAATSVLVSGDPTLAALAGGLSAFTTTGPDLGRLTNALVAAAPGIAQGFLVNFPDQASEPGTQPLDPFANPLRDYWRGAAVFTCQSFGLPIAPGCMTKFLAASATPTSRVARTGADSAATISQLLGFLTKR